MKEKIINVLSHVNDWYKNNAKLKKLISDDKIKNWNEIIIDKKLL